MVCLVVGCVQDVRNSINRKVERFTTLIHKLRVASVAVCIHPDAPTPLIGVKRGVVHYPNGT